MSEILIRIAVAGDLDRIEAVERDANILWAAACGFEGEPGVTPRATLQAVLGHGLLFVAALPPADGGAVVGFLAAVIRADEFHIGEMSVERAFQKRGIGRGLMQYAIAEARRRGAHALTLTTDRFAPFNAAFYASLGFREPEQEAMSPALAESLRHEIESGLDPARRMVMRLDLAD